MTDTADNAPDEAVETPAAEEGLNENAQAVADAVSEKTGEPSTDDFEFVLDKYKADGRTDTEAAMEQAKAYKELQSKFGAFTGAPEEYEVAVSEAMSEHINLEDFKDDPILEEAKTMAKEMGLNNEGFNAFAELYFKGQVADTQAMDAHRDEEMKALGNNAQRRLDNITDWAKHHLDADTGDKLTGALTSAAAVEAVEAVISRTRNAPQVNDAPPAEAISHEKIKAMQMEKDEFGNSKMNDPEHRAKVQRLYSQRFGDEPQNRTIG